MELVLEVSGMSCGHCEKAIKNALHELKGVHNVQIDLAKGKVRVGYDRETVTKEKICNVIDEQGYDVVR